MAELKLLPDKEFEIILNDGTVIEGRATIWTTNKLCLKNNIPLSQIEELLSKERMTLDDTIHCVLYAAEYKAKKQKKPFYYSLIDASDWIEDLGSIESVKLIRYVLGQGEELKEQGEDEEKKSLLSGEN